MNKKSLQMLLANVSKKRIEEVKHVNFEFDRTEKFEAGKSNADLQGIRSQWTET